VAGSSPDTPPTSSRSLSERMVQRWCEADRGHAFLKTDHDVIDSTMAVRSVIADRLQHDLLGLDRDLLHAFGMLGRLIGERAGSPTLASAVVDGALEALGSLGPLPLPQTQEGGPAWVRPARAAVAEAFALAELEKARAAATARWEYPACAVAVGEGTVAIAAGYPDDDGDALGAWAGRVAHAAAMAGVRRVVVSGSQAAEAALGEALEMAGIAAVLGQAAPTRPRPWRR
jgi:hypothetical protein